MNSDSRHWQLSVYSDAEELEAFLREQSLKPREASHIAKAYFRAKRAHAGILRKSGEPFFSHCLAVANILAAWNLDAEAIAAGFLHDVVEDTDISIDALEAEFGATVAMLVAGVTKIKQMPITIAPPMDARSNGSNSRGMEDIRKILESSASELRIVLIKLADRLHNMRTLGFMPRDKQRKIAQETLYVYAPLADILGIAKVRWELEDISFRYLNPEVFRKISKELEESRDESEKYIERIRRKLARALEAAGLQNFEVTSRTKSIYSIHKKMIKKSLPLEQIFDIRGLRVLVPEKMHCYLALGVVHALWHHIANELDDYIGNPKKNKYRSLHTAVRADEGKAVEVQIRTWEMHEQAEYGIAAHWLYKGSAAGDTADLEQFRANWHEHVESASEAHDASEFVESVLLEGVSDEIACLTPKDDVVTLPVGATPIDFAYKIHTEIGERCRGAKVNGRRVELNHKLQENDRVEISTVNRGGPNIYWLNPDHEYFVTNRARSNIRHWLRRQPLEHRIATGRGVLLRELRRLGSQDKISLEKAAELLGFTARDEFLAAVGAGEITGPQISLRILEEEQPERNPAAGQLPLEQYPARKAQQEKVKVVVNGSDGIGFAKNITEIVESQSVNADIIEARKLPENKARVFMILEIENNLQLTRILNRIELAPNVDEVRRLTS